MIFKKLIFITFLIITACGGSGEHSDDQGRSSEEFPLIEDENPDQLSTTEASNLLRGEIGSNLESLKAQFESQKESISEAQRARGTFGGSSHVDAVDQAFDSHLILALSTTKTFVLDLYDEYEINGAISESNLNRLRVELDEYIKGHVSNSYESTFSEFHMTTLQRQLGYNLASRLAYLSTSLKARGM